MKPEDKKGSATEPRGTINSATKKPWQPMKLVYSGEAKDIVRSGGGKTSVTLADMGDTNKPKGQG